VAHGLAGGGDDRLLAVLAARGERMGAGARVRAGGRGGRGAQRALGPRAAASRAERAREKGVASGSSPAGSTAPVRSPPLGATALRRFWTASGWGAGSAGSSPAAAVTSTASRPKNPPIPPRTTRRVLRMTASSPSSSRICGRTSSIVAPVNCLLSISAFSLSCSARTHSASGRKT
jgi:hypothetical protein